jgi:hypothetical protein
MRILVAAAPILFVLLSSAAYALDDTPTQTPYQFSKADSPRSVNVTVVAPAPRKAGDADETRRPARITAVLASPKAAADKEALLPADATRAAYNPERAGMRR